MSHKNNLTPSAPRRAANQRRAMPAAAFPQGIQAGDGGPLQEEIDSLHAFLRRLRGELDSGLSLEESLKVLDALGKGSVRLAVLLKANRDLGGAVDRGAVARRSLDGVIEIWKQKRLPFASGGGAQEAAAGPNPVSAGGVPAPAGEAEGGL